MATDAMIVPSSWRNVTRYSTPSSTACCCTSVSIRRRASPISPAGTAHSHAASDQMHRNVSSFPPGTTTNRTFGPVYSRAVAAYTTLAAARAVESRSDGTASSITAQNAATIAAGTRIRVRHRHCRTPRKPVPESANITRNAGSGPIHRRSWAAAYTHPDPSYAPSRSSRTNWLHP